MEIVGQQTFLDFFFNKHLMKGKVSVQDPQERQYSQQGRRGREQEKGNSYVCPRGRKDCLCIKRRQTWPTGKWRFIKVQEETPC